MLVYKIVDLQTGNGYVGKTTKTVEERFKEHLKLLHLKRHHNPWLQNIYNKDPNRISTIEVLEDGISCLEFLNERECYWIEQQGSFNIARGGTGGDTLSKHPDKKRIMKARLEKYPMKKGKDNPTYIHLTKEQEELLEEVWNNLEIQAIKFLAEKTNISRHKCKQYLLEKGYTIPNRHEVQKKMFKKGLIKGSRDPNLTDEQIEYVKKAYVEDWKSCKQIGVELGFKGEETALRIIKEAGLLRSTGEWTTYKNLNRGKKKEV